MIFDIGSWTNPGGGEYCGRFVTGTKTERVIVQMHFKIYALDRTKIHKSSRTDDFYQFFCQNLIYFTDEKLSL